VSLERLRGWEHSMKLHATEDDIMRRELAAERKAILRAHGRCINGPLDGYVSKRGTVHGPVVRGSKCARCCAVHDGARV
jgi:hypothetical protein